MVAQPLEEMTKGELLRLLQDMQDRQEKWRRDLRPMIQSWVICTIV